MKLIIFCVLISFCSFAHALSEEEKVGLKVMAEAGDSEAMYALFMDVAERGADKVKPTKLEYADAKKWLLKAGELKNWRAAFVLELCYRSGCWELELNENKAKHYKSVYEKYRPNKNIQRSQ